MALPPKKRRPPPPKSRGYTPEDHEGKLYRVRDKDWGDGQPIKVWGENLTYESAHKLKETVVGAGKSRTARIEDMTTPMPDADPTLEAVRQSGLAAGRGAAHAAQARVDELRARRKQEAMAASAPKGRPQPQLVRKPGSPVIPKAPPAPVMDLDDTDLEAPEVEDESEADEGSEIASVEAAANDDINEYEQKGRDLWTHYAALKGITKTWEQLGAKEQAALSFEANAEQGPHITELLAAATPTDAVDAPNAVS